jgi:hypothetical protein
MSVNLTAIRSLLLEGLNDVTGSYEMIPKQWDKVFTTRTSHKNQETIAQMAFLALPALKSEGAQAAMDNGAGERWKWNFIHQTVALGYAITREAIEDNLYKTSFQPTNLKMQEAFAQYKEITAANILNLCATTITGLGGDGKALAAVDHPVDGSTWANTSATPKDLNEASLITIQQTIPQTFVNERGLRIMARARGLVVPHALEAVAHRLTKTELRPGTANNDINAIKTVAGGLPDGVTVMSFLTSNYQWFVTTNIDGLLHFKRRAYDMDMQPDFLTMNLLVMGSERYSFGFNDPRAIWAESPTS